MEITYLFLALLFVVGLLNIYFQAPSKKFSAWFQSFAVKISVRATASSEAAETKELVSNKERSCGGIVAAGSRKVELKRVFATFDKNGDGFITKQEMKESLKNIRVIVSDKEVEELVVKVDSNGDGLIDLEEFCTLCESIGVQESTNLTSSGKGEEVEEVNIVEEGDGEGDLMEAFNVFDKDEDGLISVEELGSVLCSLGLTEGKKVEDCKEMIRKVDMDGDGMVNFDEFKRMMRGEGKLVSAF